AAERPDAPALVDAVRDMTLTWAELDDQVDSLSAGLSAVGLVAGQRVAFALANSTTFVVTYLAVARCGLVAVPMNPHSATGELARMLADSGARLVVGDSTTADALRPAVADQITAPALVVDGTPAEPGERPYDELLAGGRARVVSPADPENLAVLLYTSGTSGRPRGAMLSHRALLANIEQVAAVEPPPTRPDDVVLGLLPLFHVYGLNAVLGQVLAQGASLVLVDRFDPEATLRLVADRAVTNVPVAPPVVAAWAGRPDAAELLAGVRLVLSGAGPLDPELGRLLATEAGVAVEQGYGLTEAAPVVTTTLTSGALAGGGRPDPAGVGGPLPGVEIEVRDPSGRLVARDAPGQVWVRGPNLFSGYWPDGAERPEPDGWWASGDIGLIDRYGDLVLVDRLRELVIVNGFNVYPNEVEAVVAEVPEVAEVAVIGVPDETTGEAVLAFVVAGPNAVGPDLTEAVSAHCAARLARYKRPREVTVVDGLPHTATGKVAKGRLRAQARRDLVLP
ncbi:MAG: acyl--CoA ligase, partial [Actinomycetota bacterium]|nr:acyl--CoA ligase [Actinomycetota bacterium]